MDRFEIPGYVVGERIGAGGFGEVFQARHLLMERDVAIKILHGSYSSEPETVARFIAEARAVARLSHPNIVEVFDFGQLADGRHYCVMELLRGKSLRELLRERPRLPLDEALPILRGIAEAVDAAHAAGIAHRDLKPDNVFVVDGGVRLIDFGLAKATTSEPITKSGLVFGTPLYMSPEQCRGNAVTLATDAYSFGVLAYQVLAGCTPFEGDALELALHHLNDPPVPPSHHHRDLSDRVDRVLLALLAKDPEVRPPSLVTAIEAIVGDAPLPAVPRRRSRVGWIAAGALVVAVGGIAFMRLRAGPVWQARIEEMRGYEENADAPAFSPDGTQIAYMSDRDRPGYFRLYVEPLDGGEARLVTPANWFVTAPPRWTADGSALLTRHGGDIVSVPIAGGTQTAVATGEVGVPWELEADDCAGRLVVLERSSPGCSACARIVMGDRTGVTEVHRFAVGEDPRSPHCDRRGAQIVYSVTTDPNSLWQNRWGDLWVVATRGGAPRRITNDGLNWGGTFVPDGTSVVASSIRAGNPNLWEFPLDGGAPRRLTYGQGPDLYPDVSPDGTRVVYSNDRTSQQIFEVPIGGQSRKLTTTFADHQTPLAVGATSIVASAYSYPSLQIVTVSDGTERVLANGRSPARIPEGIAYVTPDERRIEVVALSGGAPRRMAELGNVIGPQLVAGGDGALHTSVLGDDGFEAWRIPLGAGRPEREAPAPWCLVVPAPLGGWRFAVRCDRDEARIFAPGEPLDPQGARVVVVSRLGVGAHIAWDATGASLVHHHNTEIRRYTIATSDDSKIADYSEFVYGLGVSTDGKTLYTSTLVAHVRRQMITNFADR